MARNNLGVETHTATYQQVLDGPDFEVQRGEYVNNSSSLPIDVTMDLPDSDNACTIVSPKASYFCCLDVNHTGPHVAGNGLNTLAKWSGGKQGGDPILMLQEILAGIAETGFDGGAPNGLV